MENWVEWICCNLEYRLYLKGDKRSLERIFKYNEEDCRATKLIVNRLDSLEKLEWCWLKELWELFKVFAQIGVLTFGGGYAMLPMIQEEIVDKRGWATDEEILDYYAIGQSTPWNNFSKYSNLYRI